MSAITKDRNTVSRGLMLRAGFLAAAAVIYAGTLLCYDGDGYVVNGANTAGYTFAGVAREAGTGGTADGDEKIDVMVAGEFRFKSSGLTITDVGKKLYLLDNQTVVLANHAGLTNWIYVGRMVEYISATEVWVRLDVAGANEEVRQFTVQVTGTNAAAISLATPAAEFGGAGFYVQSVQSMVAYPSDDGDPGALLFATTDYTLASGTITQVGNKTSKKLVITFVGKLT